MFEVETKIIKGCNYQVAKMPGKKGLKLLSRIASVVGPVMASAAEASGGATNADEVRQSIASGGLANTAKLLFEKADEAFIDHVTEKLCEHTQIDKAGGDMFVPLKPLFDQHFAGNYGELIEWVRFALEVQYGNLSESVASLFG